MANLPITMHTSKGDIEITLFADQVPVTVCSFVNLARHGFYDSISFHRVIPDFMIQGGDPTGTGTGGPGYQFDDEIVPGFKHDKPGILSMANAGVRDGRGTNGSQFFITHAPQPHLDGKHSVFGEVTSGQDVVNAIAQGDTISGITFRESPDTFLEGHAEKVAQFDEALRKAGFLS